MARLDPNFLVPWVRAELEALGEAAALDAHAARAQEDGLDPDEAELDAAGDLAARRGLAAALEGAAAPLWLTEVREARGLSERVERSGPSCVAWLRATPGAAQRLAQLVATLVADPRSAVAELAGLGGTPGCATR
ncbi:MAG TPA: hypothetical protein VF994_07995 [Myxococcales bacterium]